MVKPPLNQKRACQRGDIAGYFANFSFLKIQVMGRFYEE